MTSCNISQVVTLSGPIPPGFSIIPADCPTSCLLSTHSPQFPLLSVVRPLSWSPFCVPNGHCLSVPFSPRGTLIAPAWARISLEQRPGFTCPSVLPSFIPSSQNRKRPRCACCLSHAEHNERDRDWVFVGALFRWAVS